MEYERLQRGVCGRASIAAHDAQIDWQVCGITIEFAKNRGRPSTEVAAPQFTSEKLPLSHQSEANVAVDADASAAPQAAS